MDNLADAPSDTIFSSRLIQSIAKAYSQLNISGSNVTREMIAKEIIRQRVFSNTKLPFLTAMVGEAVKNGEVRGFSATRGVNGGIYSLRAP